ncbi:MAG: hypothetical protein HRU17_01260 [Polyangiaceae bacterium]|nr:hypothetical protein [Polyangiaceae bacterium]
MPTQKPNVESSSNSTQNMAVPRPVSVPPRPASTAPGANEAPTGESGVVPRAKPGAPDASVDAATAAMIVGEMALPKQSAPPSALYGGLNLDGDAAPSGASGGGNSAASSSLAEIDAGSTNSAEASAAGSPKLDIFAIPGARPPWDGAETEPATTAESGSASDGEALNQKVATEGARAPGESTPPRTSAETASDSASPVTTAAKSSTPSSASSSKVDAGIWGTGAPEAPQSSPMISSTPKPARVKVGAAKVNRPVSVPPPPPSCRAIADRPKSVTPGNLPPPASARRPLATASGVAKRSLPQAAPVANARKLLNKSTDQKQIQRLQGELDTLRMSLSAQKLKARTDEKERERLRKELEALKKQNFDAISVAAPSNAEVSVLNKKVRALQSSSSKLSGELKAISERHSEAMVLMEAKHASALEAASSADEAGPSQDDGRISELEARLSVAKNSIALLTEKLAQSPAVACDFTQLKGVGPAFAKALRAQGVSSFAQMAGWTPEEIEEIAPKLKTTVARIQRDAWVESAVQLAAGTD